MTTQEIKLKITAEAQKAIKSIEDINQKIGTLTEQTKKARESQEKFAKAMSSLGKVAVSLAGLKGVADSFKDIIETGANFESSMAKVKAISGATGEEFQALKEKAIELGGSTDKSASEVADAMNYMAMAGMKTKDILASISDVLKLSTIGNTDLARTSDIVTDALTAFGLSANETGRLVDVMTSTITNSNTTIEMLGESFKNVAPVATSFGLSVEETSSLLGVLANSGIKAERAGTSLKIVLQRLATPTKANTELLKQLGVNIYDNEGKIRNLVSVIKELSVKLKGLSEDERNKAIQQIFGSEAQASVLAIISNLKDLDALLNKTKNSAGLAGDKYKVMMDNLRSDYKALASALETLKIKIYEELLPSLRELTQNATEFTRWVTENKDEIEIWGKAIIETTVALAGLRKAFLLLEAMQLATGVTTLSGAFAALAGKIKEVSLALLALVRANPILLALGAAIAGFEYYVANAEAEIAKLNKQTEKLNNINKENSTLLDELSKKYNANTNTLKATKVEQDGYIKAIDSLIKKKRALIKTYDPNKQAAEINAQKESIKVLEELKDKIKNATLAKQDDIKVTKEAAEATKKYSQEELNALRDTYSKRVKEHESTINRLENKEQELANKIIQIQQELQQRLKQIEFERLKTIESIDDEIRNLRNADLSKYEQYTDRKIQAEEKLAKAKKALSTGDLELYRHYADEYKRLIESIANTEIKENNQVLITKQESNRVAIAGLQTLKALENEYFNKKKAEEIELHNQKIRQLQVELQATKTQIQLETQRLLLEKQLLETLTGKKVNIDVSGAISSIKKIDEQIKALDSKIKTPQQIRVDNSQAVGAIQEVDRTFGRLTLNGKTLVVKADTTPADFGIKRLISYYDENGVINIETNPEFEKAEKIIKQKIKDFENRKINAKIDADTKQAESKTREVKIKAAKPSTFELKAKAQKALNIINRLKKPITTQLNIRVNATEAFKVIRQLQRNTSSIHTIYIREVHKRATGGFIRRRGKIPGHDLTGRDDVPALLSQGEYVLNTRAVDYYGVDFIEKLNRLILPKNFIPQYASGGLVGFSYPTTNKNNVSGKMVNINLNVGGKTFQMMSDEEVANALVRYLERNKI